MLPSQGYTAQFEANMEPPSLTVTSEGSVEAQSNIGLTYNVDVTLEPTRISGTLFLDKNTIACNREST